MKDYTEELGFWKRLESFISDVQTGCCAGEEEKDMIMHVCKFKILDLHNVSHCACSVDETTGWTQVKCCNICGKPLKDQDWHCG